LPIDEGAVDAPQIPDRMAVACLPGDLRVAP